MKRLKGIWQENAKLVLAAIVLLTALAGLLFYKLGSLVGGLSIGEVAVATAPVGWHGIYQHPLDLPLSAVRSVVFYVSPDHGQILTRLPNAFFGGLAVITFGWLIYLWHGVRTALFATLMFATSAWTLHVSRLASFDVMYLWAIPTLLLIQVYLHRHGNKAVVWYGSLTMWSLMLYIPGMVWLILAQLICQRTSLAKAWKSHKGWPQWLFSILAVVVWLPLLVNHLVRHGEVVRWLGAPEHLASPLHLAKQFGGVFVHVFFRGPQYPDLWLARAPILDIFTLLAAGLGIYFYARNWKASRSQTLGALFAVSVILVALAGPVSLSAVVALLYVMVAAGVAYLLHEWLKVFPSNPLARGIGIGLVTAVVLLSCLYNVRAYFIAWPHNQATKIVFLYHR